MKFIWFEELCMFSYVPNIMFAGRVSPQSAAAMGSLGVGGNKPTVTCEICGKKLADPSSLYRHRKIHSGDKPHKCPYCTRRFIQRLV